MAGTRGACDMRRAGRRGASTQRARSAQPDQPWPPHAVDSPSRSAEKGTVTCNTATRHHYEDPTRVSNRTFKSSTLEMLCDCNCDVL